jgi:hypothetical protein
MQTSYFHTLAVIDLLTKDLLLSTFIHSCACVYFRETSFLGEFTQTLDTFNLACNIFFGEFTGVYFWQGVILFKKEKQLS